MDLIHNVRLTVFAKEDEDMEKIRQGIINLAGIDLGKEKIKLTEQTASGFKENIKILEIFLEKKRYAKLFLKHLLAILSADQKVAILKQAKSRLDEELHFFIRFDKEQWLNDKAQLTDTGKCYHIKISVASYPRSRENALKVIKEMFS